MTVDHLVYATPDLPTGVARVARLLGVEPRAGGQHPGRGTRNALVALGARMYLEIVGPDPDQRAPNGPRWFGVDSLLEPRLVTWAAGAADIEASVEHARLAGIGLGPLGQGRRTRADGVELFWRFTDPASVVGAGVVPFLIDWGTSPHPAATAPDGGAFISLRAEHPDPSSVERCLQVLELEMDVTRGRVPALVATIRTRHGEVELR